MATFSGTSFANLLDTPTYDLASLSGYDIYGQPKALSLYATGSGGEAIQIHMNGDFSDFSGLPAESQNGTVTQIAVWIDGSLVVTIGGINDFYLATLVANGFGPDLPYTLGDFGEPDLNEGADYFSISEAGTMRGGKGNDSLTGSNEGDSIYGQSGKDKLSGYGGNDLLSGGNGKDKLYGGKGSDTLMGGRNSDILVGGSGQDALQGGGGSDRLTGGAGDDMLTGGRGEDTFIFKAGSGVDVITDFEDGIDTVRIDGQTSLDIVISEGPAGVFITGTDIQILVQGMTITNFTYDDMTLALV